MLDIHTHILPGMDDGSRTPEQSLTMLQREAEQGIRMVALTPHYHAGKEAPDQFVARRKASEQLLNEALRGKKGMPELLAGAEVAYFDGMCRSEDIELLCIGRTKAMLIEMPFCKWNQRMIGELQELRQFRGIQPVLAHIERYMPFQSSGLVDQLIENGMLIQANTSFFLRWQTAWKASSMLKHQKIHFVATDCHDTVKRVPNLGETLQKLEQRLGTQTRAFLENSAQMLLGGME